MDELAGTVEYKLWRTATATAQDGPHCDNLWQALREDDNHPIAIVLRANCADDACRVAKEQPHLLVAELKTVVMLRISLRDDQRQRFRGFLHMVIELVEHRLVAGIGWPQAVIERSSHGDA
jgi:hypothetical protein